MSAEASPHAYWAESSSAMVNQGTFAGAAGGPSRAVISRLLASAACKASADTGCGNSGLGVHLCPRRPGHHPGTHGRHLANLPHVESGTCLFFCRAWSDFDTRSITKQCPHGLRAADKCR